MMIEPCILYQDDIMLAVGKPQGMPAQPDPSGQLSLLAYLQERYAFVELVHRLDTPTGGVMIFSRAKDKTGILSSMINDKDSTKKEYLAVLSSTPKLKEGTLEDDLFHDKRLNKSFVVTPSATGTLRKGAKHAILQYTILDTTTNGGLSLAHVRLLTGRTHQIRVQFASRGCPLAGDGKYGSRIKLTPSGIALWSYSLTLMHPITKKLLCITQLPPQENTPWSSFDLSSINQ